MLVRYAPGLEFEFDPDFEALGLGGTFQGRQGLLELIDAFAEGFERWEVRPAAILDLGDEFLLLGTMRLHGAASGLELEREFAQLEAIRDGLVARERQFLGWDKGIRAAGLNPEAVGSLLPEARHPALRGTTDSAVAPRRKR